MWETGHGSYGEYLNRQRKTGKESETRSMEFGSGDNKKPQWLPNLWETVTPAEQVKGQQRQEK